MSPTLLAAIQNTNGDHRRSIIQAIREIEAPNKFQTILIALAAEIEITTILENEELRQFESEMTD
jgi:ribosome-binding ATPase YchF (GTP1/OBG family)